jgi:cell division protein FtsQ
VARPAAGGKRRPGDRWQPVIGPRLTRRVAGRRELRLPPVELPRLDVRWRRLALPALLLAGLALGAWWLYRSPLLTVRDVSVEGTSAISAEIVREAAGLDGQSIFRADYDGARERVLALPLVKSVQIERDWPNGARIAVVERAPWGVWQAAGQSFVVDDEGVVLGLPAPAGAPTIVQTDAPASPSPSRAGSSPRPSRRSGAP